MRRLIVFVILMMGLPLRAQEAAPHADTTAPLLEALAFVPDDENSRQYVYYGDFELALEARGLPRLSNAEISRANLTSRVGFAIPGYFEFLATFNFASNMVDLVGFELLDIARAVEFGRQPQQGLALLGMFEGEAIAAAHQARGYEAMSEGDVRVWCFKGDCSADIDFENRDTANIFGGYLGRSQPVGIIGDDGVFSSPNEAVFDAMVAAVDGSIPTLADAPDFQALARALGALGPVRQLQSFDALLMWQLDFPGIRTPDPRPEGTLPQYGVFAIADVVLPEGELAVVALVYDSAEVATEAAAVLERRLETFPARGQASLRREFLQEGAERVETMVYADELTGMHVVMVVIAAPPPDDTVADQRQPSGRFFVTLNRAILSFRIPWVAQ